MYYCNECLKMAAASPLFNEKGECPICKTALTPQQDNKKMIFKYYENETIVAFYYPGSPSKMIMEKLFELLEKAVN